MDTFNCTDPEIDPAEIAALRGLWLEVLRHALREALGDFRGSCNNHLANGYRQTSREYVERNTMDFQMVCSLAGLEPAYVRRKYFEWKESGKDPQALLRNKRA